MKKEPVHPHVCGENDRCRPGRADLRFTPTYVGKMLTGRMWHESARFIPQRMWGNFLQLFRFHFLKQLPPRMWGK